MRGVEQKTADKIAGIEPAVSSIFAQVGLIREAESNIALAEQDYSPIHGVVRDIEREVRRLERNNTQLKRERRGTDDKALKDELQHEIDETEARIVSLKRAIPPEWESAKQSL